MTEAYTNQPGQRLDLPDPQVAMRGSTMSGIPYQVVGSVMQTLMLALKRGQSVFTEAGALAWMREGINMQTNLGKGGLFGAMKRSLSGESLFVVNYTSEVESALIAFACSFPGKIIPVNLSQGQSMIAQRDVMLVAEQSVNVTIALQKRLTAGLFGGEGFILQKMEGPGTFFAALDGEVVEYTLNPGEKLLVDTGHVAMFEPSVAYEVTMVKGVANMLVGGEGLFLVKLTGPGRVWLQTMPVTNLAGAIAPYLPAAKSSS